MPASGHSRIMSLTALTYRAATTALSPLLPIWLKRRARNGKEDIARITERYGVASLSRPDGTLFWMHGASVGETLMLLPLIKALLVDHPKAYILVTSGTVTSAKLMAQRLPARCFHQYAPLDTPKAAKRFLAHWQPDLAIWAESEIWPNLILESHKRGVPMALINARMSEKSLKGWARHKKFAAKIFISFNYIQAANAQTAEALSKFTAQNLPIFASLKEAGSPLGFDNEQAKTLTEAIGTRPIWCAASTHAGEDEIILNAHAKILAVHPNAIILLAPRHPERSQDVHFLALNIIDGANCAFHSRKDLLTDKTQIYIFDTIGDMGLAFNLSAVTMMCGSLTDGLLGHNPLEPARHKNAVLTGPNVESFKNIYQDMFAFDAAVTILDDMQLSQTICRYFAYPEELKTQQDKAYEFSQNRRAILDVTLDNLRPLIDTKRNVS
ncbi:MAG: 3-deoxy-D-manno-octulosonic acid transferase [Litorimonas sp.]